MLCSDSGFEMEWCGPIRTCPAMRLTTPITGYPLAPKPDISLRLGCKSYPICFFTGNHRPISPSPASIHPSIYLPPSTKPKPMTMTIPTPPKWHQESHCRLPNWLSGHRLDNGTASALVATLRQAHGQRLPRFASGKTSTPNTRTLLEEAVP